MLFSKFLVISFEYIVVDSLVFNAAYKLSTFSWLKFKIFFLSKFIFSVNFLTNFLKASLFETCLSKDDRDSGIWSKFSIKSKTGPLKIKNNIANQYFESYWTQTTFILLFQNVLIVSIIWSSDQFKYESRLVGRNYSLCFY